MDSLPPPDDELVKLFGASGSADATALAPRTKEPDAAATTNATTRARKEMIIERILNTGHLRDSKESRKKLEYVFAFAFGSGIPIRRSVLISKQEVFT